MPSPIFPAGENRILSIPSEKKKKGGEGGKKKETRTLHLDDEPLLL